MAITQTHSVDISGNKYTTITDAAQTGLDFTTAMTLEGWFYFDSFPGGLASLFGKQGGTGQRGPLFFYDTGSPSLRLNNSGDGSSIEQENVSWSPSLATWYHLAITFDGGAGEVKFYVDGAQQGATQTTAITSIFNNSVPFQVGASGGGSFSHDGKIKDARAWSVVRTQTEINDNKDNCDLDPATTGLEAWWAFNNDYTDETSNGNTLTAVNSPTFITDLPYTCAGGGDPVFVPKVSMII